MKVIIISGLASLFFFIMAKICRKMANNPEHEDIIVGAITMYAVSLFFAIIFLCSLIGYSTIGL